MTVYRASVDTISLYSLVVRFWFRILFSNVRILLHHYRSVVLVRTHEYGLVLQNDNDAIESERLRIEYETRTGQQVNRD